MSQVIVDLHIGDRASYILVLGEGYAGKSYLIRKYLKHFKRVVVITPNHEEFKDYPNRVVTFEPEVCNDTIRKALLAGNCMVLIDDSDVILKKIENDHWFKYLIASGRHRGCGWTIASRRTQDIPTLVPKQANRLFLFQTDLPHDIEFINEWFNLGEEVKALDRQKHEFLYVNRDSKEQAVMVA